MLDGTDTRLAGPYPNCLFHIRDKYFPVPDLAGFGFFLDHVRHLFGNGLEFFSGGEVKYRDDFNSSGDNDPLDVMDSYTKVNIRVGLRGEHWEAMFFGRNIFDEEAYAQGFDTPVLAGSHTRFMEEGEIWGVKLTGRF